MKPLCDATERIVRYDWVQYSVLQCDSVSVIHGSQAATRSYIKENPVFRPSLKMDAQFEGVIYVPYTQKDNIQQYHLIMAVSSVLFFVFIFIALLFVSWGFCIVAREIWDSRRLRDLGRCWEPRRSREPGQLPQAGAACEAAGEDLTRLYDRTPMPV